MSVYLKRAFAVLLVLAGVAAMGVMFAAIQQWFGRAAVTGVGFFLLGVCVTFMILRGDA